jgi:hypothetical protein
MYAEDIDLSFRIARSGHVNFYLAEVSIIHFKGESTLKNKQYVKLFYKAMIQFAQKYYKGMGGKLYVQFLEVAIWIRASLAAGRLRLSKQQHEGSTGKKKIFLWGDQVSMQQVSASISNSNQINITQDRREMSEIVICEGEQFSFFDVIDAMKKSPGKNYQIHALDSSSLVGSYDTRGTGVVIELKRGMD